MVPDRFLRPLWRLVRRWVDERIGYAGMWPATVQSQSSDGSTLDIKPVDTDQWGNGFTASVVYGIPGVKCTFPVGTKVWFGFFGSASAGDAGDSTASPGLPFVPFSFNVNNPPGVVLTVVNGQQAGGAQSVARVGDSTGNGTLTGTVLVASAPVPVQFTYVPQGGGAPVGPGPSATLGGKITSGNPNFLA